MPSRKRHRSKHSTGAAAEPWLVTDAAAVATLARTLYDPERNQPLIVVSVPSDTRRPRLDVTDLATQAELLGTSVDIAVVCDPRLAWQLSNTVADHHRTYGGATRLFWPRATLEDPEGHHPLFVTLEDEQGPKTVRALCATLAARARREQTQVRTPPEEPPAGTPGWRPPKPGPSHLTSAPATRQAAHETAPRPTPEPPQPAPGATPPDTASHPAPEPASAQQRGVEDSTQARPPTPHPRRLNGLRSKRDTPPTADPTPDPELERYRETAAKLTAENAELRRQVRSLTDRTAELERRLTHRDVFTDPARQLLHEISTAWLLRHPEAERDAYPLRDAVVGPAFLDSVDQTAGIERERVIEGCMDVLTRRAYEINSRNVRPYRSSKAASAPQRVRADGATAWRANLQADTPAARRLMWWELPNGHVELARVGTHDDYRELR